MKPLDKVLQHWRIIKASKWIPEGARVLDFGCHQGELFNRLQNTIGFSLGFDPLVRTNSQANAILLPWIFSEPMPLASASFDVITLLATF